MRQLFLEDLAGLTEDEVKAHIKDSYCYNGDLSKYKILVAYESVGSWGCDSSSWFLLSDICSGNYMKRMEVIVHVMVLKTNLNQRKQHWSI